MSPPQEIPSSQGTSLQDTTLQIAGDVVIGVTGANDNNMANAAIAMMDRLGTNCLQLILQPYHHVPPAAGTSFPISIALVERVQTDGGAVELRVRHQTTIQANNGTQSGNRNNSSN
ncbi:hypothetical protein F53441_1676 [Fusarium austroafricanum]|uniref:Uncharacterized protein n=1 Tax=Fusarium austroafricanum TaxID=2364996 RepID=A0A8H4P4S4_9HYPO|nr:hypothetical protein F53441_1676 [Fusarium austroafricanum]